MKHTCILLLAVLLICQQSFAQLSLKKQAGGGGSSIDLLVKLCLAKDGGAVAAGTSSSDHSFYKSHNNFWDSTKYPNARTTDYWVVKASKQRMQNGSYEEWDKTIGGSGDDQLEAAISTSDGGYLLAGISNSDVSGNKTAPHFGASFNYNTWVVKLDANGNIKWDKTYDTAGVEGGGEVNDGINAVAQTKDNGYIFLCSRFLMDNFVNVSKLIKTDAQGNVQWQIDSINFKGYGYPTDLKVTEDGGYILGGGTGNKSFAHGPEMLVKTDDAANIQWSNFYGGAHDEFSLFHVNTTADGGYILYGTYDSVAVFVDGGGNNYQVDNNYVGIFKTDNAGNLQWHDTLPVGKYDENGNAPSPFSALTETADHQFIVGYSKQKEYNGWSQWHIDKINTGGGLLWSQDIATTNEYDNDYIADIQVVGPNHYLIGGYTLAGIGGDKTVSNLGSYDYWVMDARDTSDATVVAPFTAKINAVKTITTKAYPNPAYEVLHIQANGKAVISITDDLGKTLLTKAINGRATIDIAKFPPGIYYLVNKTASTTQKIIIAH